MIRSGFYFYSYFTAVDTKILAFLRSNFSARRTLTNIPNQVAPIGALDSALKTTSQERSQGLSALLLPYNTRGFRVLHLSIFSAGRRRGTPTCWAVISTVHPIGSPVKEGFGA